MWECVGSVARRLLGEGARRNSGLIFERPRNVLYDPFYEESPFGPTPRTRVGGLTTVTLVPGIGGGERVSQALMDVFSCAGAPVSFELISDASTNEQDFDNLLLSIQRNGLAIKGNIETRKTRTYTVGMSKNMLVRKKLDLYVNVMEFKNFSELQNIMKIHDDFDVVLMRQNTEGDYSMLVHSPLETMVEHLRIITKANSVRLSKFAFEYALKNKRKKVTLVHNKDIIPTSESVFISSFFEVSKNYPTIRAEDMYLTTLLEALMKNVKNLDIILSNSMLGSILSAIFHGFLGSAELVPSKSMGDRLVMYEPVSLRWLRDFDTVERNPISLFQCGIGVLEHLGHKEHANVIRESIQETLAEGVLTEDLKGTATVEEFTSFVISCVKMKVRHVLCRLDEAPAIPPTPVNPTKPFHPDFMPGMSPPEPNYKKIKPPSSS